MSRRKPAKPFSGYCNICNESKELTRDHVPPKGSINLKPVEIRNLLQRIGDLAPGRVNRVGEDALWEGVTSSYELSQDGMKFRSICATCNNDRLGARYDLELNRVSRVIGSRIRMHLRSLIFRPSEIQVSVRTHYLVRAIVGHVLAAHGSKDRAKPLPEFNGGFYADLRSYFLDESLPLPDGVKVYYWPYLGEEQVIITGLGLSSINGVHGAVGDLIKFSPMAYYIAFSPGDSLDLPVPSIRGHGCNDLDCEVSLLIKLDSIPPQHWPENPAADHHTLFLPDLSYVATPRARQHGN